MEAMASGCSIVASATPPVEEMITTGDQGQLVDFFDPDALAQQIDHLLQSQEKRQRLGHQARQHILEGGYDLQHALKQQVQLLNQVMRG
jgi:glycosyltransferase involved in cell wall biosynthesis